MVKPLKLTSVEASTIPLNGSSPSKHPTGDVSIVIALSTFAAVNGACAHVLSVSRLNQSMSLVFTGKVFTTLVIEAIMCVCVVLLCITVDQLRGLRLSVPSMWILSGSSFSLSIFALALRTLLPATILKSLCAVDLEFIVRSAHMFEWALEDSPPSLADIDIIAL